MSVVKHAPMVRRVEIFRWSPGTGPGVSTGPLVGKRDKIVTTATHLVEWCRNAVTTRANGSSADIFGEAKPLLRTGSTQVTRDEIIAALMALPAGNPTGGGVRVNGINTIWPRQFSAASGTDNRDASRSRCRHQQ
jgi:hypothetical protein